MGLTQAIFQMPHFELYLSSFSSLLNHFISQLLLHSASASRELAVLPPSRLSENLKEDLTLEIWHKNEMLFLIVFLTSTFPLNVLQGFPPPILQFPFPPLCLARIPASFCRFNGWGATELLGFPPPLTAGKRSACSPWGNAASCRTPSPCCAGHPC